MRPMAAAEFQVPLTRDPVFLSLANNYITQTFVIPENVVMGDLIRLSTAKEQHIRIIETSAVKYRDIGTILLKDDTGAIVTGIAQTARDNSFEAVRMIYERWIQENEDHSWKKLIQCLRKVRLNSLAGEIEQHFTLPSPSTYS